MRFILVLGRDSTTAVVATKWPAEPSRKISCYIVQACDTHGSFTAIAPPTVGSAPGGVFLVDLNRDGKLDLVLGNGTSPYVSILLGHGNGTFSAPTSPAAPTGPLAVMDVNRDGKLDLVFSEGNAPGFAQTTISVLLGEGNGQFTGGPPSPVVDNGCKHTSTRGAASAAPLGVFLLELALWSRSRLNKVRPSTLDHISLCV
jgi:hypothetical protein